MTRNVDERMYAKEAIARGMMERGRRGRRRSRSSTAVRGADAAVHFYPYCEPQSCNDVMNVGVPRSTDSIAAMRGAGVS